MASREELIKAIDAALSGRWDEAHSIVQEHEGDQRANLIHAVLHRQEGDEANAMYWYRRAGSDGIGSGEPDAELRDLRNKLVDQS